MGGDPGVDDRIVPNGAAGGGERRDTDKDVFSIVVVSHWSSRVALAAGDAESTSADLLVGDGYVVVALANGLDGKLEGRRSET